MKHEHRSVRQDRSGKGLSFVGGTHPAIAVGLFVFFLSGMAYVYALNFGATGGYEIRKVENELAELTEENRRLRLSEAQALSLSRIEESVRGREMDRAAELRTVGGRGAVAVR